MFSFHPSNRLECSNEAINKDEVEVVVEVEVKGRL